MKNLEENVLQKLATHPLFQDVIARVRTAGLHRTAACLAPESAENAESVTLKTAMARLGGQLLQQRLRHQKIASGLQAYDLYHKL